VLTGEPYAGDLHVRFGGRGGSSQCAVPTPVPPSGSVHVDTARHGGISKLTRSCGLACMAGLLPLGWLTCLFAHFPYPCSR
jgi:hypothetical protein